MRALILSLVLAACAAGTGCKNTPEPAVAYAEGYQAGATACSTRKRQYAKYSGSGGEAHRSWMSGYIAACPRSKW